MSLLAIGDRDLRVAAILNQWTHHWSHSRVVPPMIYWTDYLKAELRGFELEKLEVYSAVADNLRLVIIPYDIENDTMIPVTVHTTTRQQIRFRLNTRRFIHE